MEKIHKYHINGKKFLTKSLPLKCVHLDSQSLSTHPDATTCVLNDSNTYKHLNPTEVTGNRAFESQDISSGA